MKEKTISLTENVRELLLLIGENPDREGLKDTPRRVAKAWGQLIKKEKFNPTVFDANGYDQMIIERDIAFYTLCEHHLIPFFGTVSIGYIPNDRIIGISKLPRTVEYYSKRLNTQEYFTDNIANFLVKTLQPKGVAVTIRGRHLCQEMRGVKKRGDMITSALRGVFYKEPKVREEFFQLCK